MYAERPRFGALGSFFFLPPRSVLVAFFVAVLGISSSVDETVAFDFLARLGFALAADIFGFVTFAIVKASTEDTKETYVGAEWVSTRVEENELSQR